MDFTQLTTTDLVELVAADRRATPRELELLERLRGAIDEIDALTRELAQLQLIEGAECDT